MTTAAEIPTLTRDGLMKAFGLSAERLAALEAEGVLAADEGGAFDLARAAASLFNYGIAHARSADERLLAAAMALSETLPALQRLSELGERAALDGGARERVTEELSAFFTVFSKALERATASLQAGG